MARSKSAEQFRRLTEELKAEVHREAVDELNAQADNLARQIELVAPRGPTGNLEHSVAKVPDRKTDTVVRIVAGGRLTIRPSVSSKPYDYARADEFGTVNMRAQPFFFPTYRLNKKKMISAMKRKIRASIKKRSAE
ncbi:MULTISPECIES: HK97-gp10 family putative phage morphogenesis protein [unclassified Bradyrhizobium]